MAVISVTKNGTLNPSLGRIDYDDSTNVAYAAGDDFTLSAGVTFRIQSDTSSRAIGTVTGALGATCLISNSSTSQVMVVKQSDATKKYSFNDACTLQIRGQFVDIATGTGAASQTLNFTTLQGGVIDRPPVLLVETGNGTGVFHPFFNIGLATDANALALSQFAGDIEHGCVFSYDPSTKIATFGDGTNGAVIPSGARVRYPNIHITSGTFSTAVTNRNEMAIRGGATLDAQCVAITQAYTFNGTVGAFAPSQMLLQDFFFGGKILCDTVLKTLTLTRVYASPELLFQTNVYGISCGGAAVANLNGLYGFCVGNTTIQGGVYIGGMRNIQSAQNLYGWTKITGTTGRYAVAFNQCASMNGSLPVTVTNVQCIGGPFQLQSSKLINVNGVKHSDQVGGVAAKTATSATFGIYLVGSSNCVVYNVSLLSGGAACGNHLTYIDIACYNCVVYNVNYDCQNNSNSSGSISGTGSFYTNVNTPNSKSLVPYTTGLPSIRWCNVTGTSLSTNVLQGGQLEFVQVSGGSSASTNTSNASDYSPHNTFVLSGLATGSLAIGPYSAPNVSGLAQVVSGTQGTDFYYSAQGLNCPGICQVIFTSRWRHRGITNFTGAVVTSSTVSWSGGTVEFRMRRPNGTWTSWYDASTAANYQTALSSLTGYTSNEGFELQTRVTTTTSVSGRSFWYYRVSCNTDSSFTAPEIGFVSVNPTTMVANSTAALYDGSTLVNVQQVSGTSYNFEFPYNFDGNYKNFKLVIRKAGYGEIVLNGQVHQIGLTQPISQTQYVSVDESVASALTGIAVDGSAKTITVTQNHTLGEIYNYCQWWAAQTSNIGYVVPIITTDGTNLSSTYQLIISGCTVNTTSGKTFTTTQAVTLSSGGVGNFLYTASNGSSANLVLTNVPSGATVLVKDNSGATSALTTNFTSGTYSQFIPAGASGTWTWKVALYGYLAGSGSFTPSSGGAQSAIVSLATDTGITQATVATVAAYTTLNTLDQRYDYCAYYETTAAGVVYSRLGVKSGSVLDWGSKNIVNDATAGSVFAWNGTTTITIKTNAPANVGTTFTESKTTGTVSFANGASVAVGAIYTDSAGRHVFVTAPNLIDGTRVQLWNSTDSTEVDNSVVSGGAGYAIQLIYSANKSYRLHATYCSGTTAKLPLEEVGTFNTNGLQFASVQTTDTVYAANGIDGSTVTEFTADFPHIQVDIGSGSTTTAQRLYAWLVYEQTTSSGVQNFFDAITAYDAVNYTINASLVNLQLNNITATPVKISGGYVARSDGATIIASTSGSIQIDPAKAYIAGLTAPIVLNPGERLLTTSNGSLYAR